MKRDRIKEDIELKEETPVKEAPKRDRMRVYINIPNLAVRTGPGTDFDKTWEILGQGTVRLQRVLSGQGSTKGWGALDENRWINLDFTDYEA